MSEFRFGSVCSGIEAASVAWHPLGWKAAWLSEIEPFPSAVLAYHYPDVPNLGDMTTLPERILSGEVEAPDLFCGGTPCQAFSVAGLRNSLDDARGNLSLTFVGIANAIDHVRSVRRDPAGIIFWENVPGVLSTKDNAFGCFLGALAGENDPLIPPGEKWTNAGCVYGPQRAVAWRVLDAQYFGVAQRRRRVFVVASARADFDPAAVLFEFDGVRRDSAPSREAGQAVAPCVTNGPTFSRTGNERVEAEAMVVAARMVAFGEYVDDGTASAMKARDWKDATDLVAQPIAFQQTADCLTAAYGTKWNGNASATNGSLFAAQPIGFNARQDPDSWSGRVGPLDTLGGTQAVAIVGPLACNTGPNGHDAGNFACNQAVDAGHVLPVAQPIPIDTMNHVGRGDNHSFGDLEPGAPSYTLTKGHSHAVAAPPTMQVRRLTPVECERLQGFPDGYTNIPWRKKPEAPDGPRYKALGNSWAVPNVRWIGQRIQKALNDL